MVGIFFITTSWGRQNGGINSINYSLIRNFTKVIDRNEWDVYCVLTEEKVDSDTISTVSETDYITLINTETPLTSTTIKKCIKNKKYDQLFFIGHDIITGEYANGLRDSYKGSISIILHHMHYQSYYYSRETHPEKIRKKEDLQKEIVPQADIIVAVGPLLLNSANDLCIDARKDNPKIHEIIPGLEDIQPIEKIHNNHTIILFGRLEERNNGVKQMGLAIDAISKYIKESDNNFIIKCYGYADDSERNQKRLLARAFKEANKSINIRANQYIENEEKLREEISSASLCIMPSFFEGFGLTAYEAISAGVPVIISQNTGLYKFLNEKQGEPIDHLFKSLKIQGDPTDPNKTYTDDDLENLKHCINEIFSDYNRSKHYALTLRTNLIDSHFTWDYTARKFAEIIENEIIEKPKKIPESKEIKKKELVNLSDYISKNLIYRHCNVFCDPKKIVLKIIKYSKNREKRFTAFSSDENFTEPNHRLKIRLINDGTVGILNRVFNEQKHEFPIIISNFTNGNCFCVTETQIYKLPNDSLGIPDHQVLSIIAVPLVYEKNIVGAITIDLYDEDFIKNIISESNSIFRDLYNSLKLLSNDLISRFYYNIIDNINFSEVNRMLTKREIVSFSGCCPLKCKHCFAEEIVNDEKENEVEDVVNSLESKDFDVIYVSHFKENFYNPNKGVSLCEELYNKYHCDICVTTRCILTMGALNRIKKLNNTMNNNGHKLTFCVSIPAYDSYNKFENVDLVPTPQQRIEFAGQLSDSNITSIVTVRPMFPSSIVPKSEIHKIIDNCVNKVDAILTGGLYISDNILNCLNLKADDLCYLENVDSEYLIGVEGNFKAVNVDDEIYDLEMYCKEKNIPFFKHSMDALNYFK